MARRGQAGAARSHEHHLPCPEKKRACDYMAIVVVIMRYIATHIGIEIIMRLYPILNVISYLYPIYILLSYFEFQ